MIDFLNNKKCSGCGACSNICPVNAIDMISDHTGFLYPEINMDKCISCNKCDSVCQINRSYEPSKAENQTFYAAVNKDDDQLMKSSSGGMFLALCRYMQELDGFIVGCVFDDDLVAYHTIIRARDNCDKMCGSKYVQSDMRAVFSQVKALLDDNQWVLFTGTPCQVEGVLLFLNKHYEKLITVDLICHGVSSPKLWMQHKEWIESQLGGKVENYQFRNKSKIGWSLYYCYSYVKNGKSLAKKGICNSDPYYMDFLEGKNYRECCYSCKYATLDRKSDFTIGDYWGAEKYHQNFDVPKGISILMPNTKNAEKIMPSLLKYIYVETSEKEWVLEKNKQLIMPTKRPQQRDSYYETIYADLNKWENDFRKTKEWKLIKIKSLIPLSVKKFIKKYIIH